MCANIAIELDGLRLVVWRGASRAEQGMPFAREAALARKLATDRGMQIGNDGVQLLGGHGYTKEHPVERWYRDLRGVGVAEGVVVYRPDRDKDKEKPDMAINLELPKKLEAVAEKGHQGAVAMFTPDIPQVRPVRAPPTPSSSTPWRICSTASPRPTPSRWPAPARSTVPTPVTRRTSTAPTCPRC